MKQFLETLIEVNINCVGRAESERASSGSYRRDRVHEFLMVFSVKNSVFRYSCEM